MCRIRYARLAGADFCGRRRCIISGSVLLGADGGQQEDASFLAGPPGLLPSLKLLLPSLTAFFGVTTMHVSAPWAEPCAFCGGKGMERDRLFIGVHALLACQAGAVITALHGTGRRPPGCTRSGSAEGGVASQPVTSGRAAVRNQPATGRAAWQA